MTVELAEQVGSIDFPFSEEQRAIRQTARQFARNEIDPLVDEMDDSVAKDYAAMPERLYLIGRDGRIAYQGGMGPMYFRPSEWEQAIAGYLGAG